MKREFREDQGRIEADLKGPLISLNELDAYVIAKACL